MRDFCLKMERINVFIIGRYSEYQTAIKNVLQEKCIYCNVYITDAYLRLWDRDQVIEDADLSIIIADHSPHDRYGSELNWFNTITKDIYTTSHKVMAILDNNKGEWNHENTKLYFVRWTIEDEYNLMMIKEKINDYFDQKL